MMNGSRLSVWSMNENLEEADSEVYNIIRNEKERQKRNLEMIASENYTSLPVLQCMSSCLHNKYSEGQPGARYYGGNEHVDQLEILAQDRALALYNLDPEKWGVNVQPYSGSPANMAVLTAVAEPHGRIMGLDLPDGGHLTHGFYTSTKKISASSIFFESLPYKVNPETGLIDYDELEKNATLFKPKMIIAGISCYSRFLDYARFRKIADINNSFLMADMAHVAGLVATGLHPSPFEFCDIVTSTVHKTLRGPRAGIIFFRKGVRSVDKTGKSVMYDLMDRINMAVFPSLQGGPHNHAIGGIAVAMRHAATREFKQYQGDVVRNAKRVAEGLMKLGYRVVTGGTDVHLVLIDLKNSPGGLTGSKGQHILEMVSISVNKNTVPGDKSAFNPSGLRLGTPSLTTRGLVGEDMDKVVAFLHRAVMLGAEAQKLSGPKLVDWKKVLAQDEAIAGKVKVLKEEVETFAKGFRLPGHELI